MRSVNLIRVKELKMDNFSTFSMDFVPSKNAKRKLESAQLCEI